MSGKCLLKKIIILGNPNVGKSVVFNNLTGQYATVSNYPGTTVEVSRGRVKIGQHHLEIIDTPGIYSLSPISEEEAVTRRIFMEEPPALVVHVIDAKNLERMLPLTFQLLEASLPVLLMLNMMDEARSRGIHIDTKALSRELGIPVIEAVATANEGTEELRKEILWHSELQGDLRRGTRIVYNNISGQSIEKALAKITNLLTADYHISKRCVGLRLLEEDAEVEQLVMRNDAAVFSEIKQIVTTTSAHFKNPLEFEVALELRHEAERIFKEVFVSEREALMTGRTKFTWSDWLNRLTINPVTGFPILFLVLYFGLYQFVGGLGAGVVVDFLEGTLFEKYINPFLVQALSSVIPWAPVRDLFIGEYGMLTLGVKYAVALILPIVAFYFFAFSIIEDTGYLPRLAMLMDKAFKKIGLSGRAVIPMVLGFGCDTMAVLVTRTLPTVRERILSVLLLSLAIPCSAQLGVILALLSPHPGALMIWIGVLLLVFVTVGFISARILPGEKPSFYMELPPLRLPKMKNVFMKTYARVNWYLLEVLPVFVLVSMLIWAGQITGILAWLVSGLAIPLKMMGLPAEAAPAFLFGFFRRDYGAAGLYDLAQKGFLNGVQLAVSCVAMTLFLPCVAQFLIMIKERGWRIGISISAITLTLAYTVSVALNFVLVKMGIVL